MCHFITVCTIKRYFGLHFLAVSELFFISSIVWFIFHNFHYMSYWLFYTTLLHFYSAVHKNMPLFNDCFHKRGLILIVLSLFHSSRNNRKSYNKIYHLASNVLPHYLGKFECASVQLYSKSIQFRSDANRLITVNIY